MKRTRILLADDHKIVLEGLRSLLEPEFELVGMAENGRTLLRLSDQLKPDAIVVDISMPLLNGIEAVRQIKEISPDISIVFLTMHPDVTYAARAFEVGASGYVLKHSAPSELVTAIHAAMKGQIYITPAIAGELIQSFKDRNHFQKETTAELTPRQREVLQLLAEGHSGKEIADILCISPRTVEYHKYRMMEELGIKTSSELVGYAIKQGIVTI